MDKHYDWEKELIRLYEVEKALKIALDEEIEKKGGYRGEGKKINKEMWEDIGGLSNDLDKIIPFLQHIRFLKNNAESLAISLKTITKFERLIQSPYFARIDFLDELDTKPESFYIGIHGFKQDQTDEPLIYDWRAPISSMFYDFETGKAHYKCPVGQIEGELTLKRQYRIENGNMKFMFDSSVAIEDDILQEILAGSADGRMKTIVTTIQREQNKAIRSDINRILAVQGPAGSGKTSVALHRAAYLLYHYRENLEAGNLLLYTPNNMFSNYISSVLPNLGEDEIPCSTLTGLAIKYLGDKFHTFGTYATMMEEQLLYKESLAQNILTSGALSQGISIPDMIRDNFNETLNMMSIKASKSFAKELEKLVRTFEENIIVLDDIGYKDIVFISKEELKELFLVTFRHMPVVPRLSRIMSIIEERIWTYEKELYSEKETKLEKEGGHTDPKEMRARARMIASAEIEPVRRKLKEMLSVDVVSLYSLLSSDYKSKDILEFVDQAPLLYLMYLLGYITKDNNVKHLIIDEAQDYSEMAFCLFSKLYSGCGISLLGDFRQNINPAYGIGNLKEAALLLGEKAIDYIELDKSYRSTVEIMEYASKVTGFYSEPFGRNGKEPELVAYRTDNELNHIIKTAVQNVKEAGCKSIAIVCRTLNACKKVYSDVKDLEGIYFIDNGDEDIREGVAVIPSYLSKGLEFDAVILVLMQSKDYEEDEKQLFYTVCTRALHRLNIVAPEDAWIAKQDRK